MCGSVVAFVTGNTSPGSDQYAFLICVGLILEEKP